MGRRLALVVGFLALAALLVVVVSSLEDGERAAETLPWQVQSPVFDDGPAMDDLARAGLPEAAPVFASLGAAAAPSGWLLRGQVRDDVGTPVRAEVVQFINDKVRMARCDAEGRFELRVQRDVIDLQVQAAGHVSARVEHVRARHGDEALIQLVRRVGLDVEVRDPAGTVLPGMAVIAWRETPGGTVVEHGRRQITDADGRATFSGQPGVWFVQAARAPTWLDGLAEGAPLPARVRPALAEVAVAPGQRKPVSVVLPWGARVVGRVTRAGSPVSDVHVALEGAVALERADHDGRFVFEGVPGGELSLRVLAAGWREIHAERVHVPRGEQVVVDIALTSARVSVRVVDVDTGAWIEGAMIKTAALSAGQAPWDVVETLQVKGDLSTLLDAAGSEHATDANGLLWLESLPPGPSSVYAVAPGYVPAEAIALRGDVDEPEREVSLRVRRGTPVQVKLRGKPAAREAVWSVLMARDGLTPTRWLSKQGQGFRALAVAPGAYTLRLKRAGAPDLERHVEIPASSGLHTVEVFVE